MRNSATSLPGMSVAVSSRLIPAWAQDGVVISGLGDTVYSVAAYPQSMVGRRGSLSSQLP